MQPFNEIEQHYEKPDPWGYKNSADDHRRRELITNIAALFGQFEAGVHPFRRALDIGAGEGWVTSMLPAGELHGYELSNNAAARFPPAVKRVSPPEGKYDLVTACGVWYPHYNWPHFQQLVRAHASNIVLVSGIADWFHPSVNDIGKEVFRAEFPYPAGKQRILVFEVKK